VAFVNYLFRDKRPSAIDRAQQAVLGYSAQERSDLPRGRDACASALRSAAECAEQVDADRAVGACTEWLDAKVEDSAGRLPITDAYDRASRVVLSLQSSARFVQPRFFARILACPFDLPYGGAPAAVHRCDLTLLVPYHATRWPALPPRHSAQYAE
jgi:hypothetical protein